MTGHWADAPLTGFDLETTTTHPATARIVSAALVTVDPDGAIHRTTWLADPGVPIPAEATAVHGISTEQARTGGAPIREVLQEVAADLEALWADGAPIVVMNAPYDLTVLGRELARYRMVPLDVGPVVDPLPIDWACVRGPSGGPGRRHRRLSALADYYGVRAADPHTADGDALTAVLVARAQVEQHEVLRQMDLVELQMWQAIVYRGWAVEYERLLRADGRPDAVVGRSWPVRPVPVVQDQEGAQA
ncbi:exonuclease domain-containing protein [Frankia sp. AvcI1]|uniref:exonuclease domain-containing protein n=1 Tax=Frankia sp. AvcI1 TaxID=573496 RepID=UPI0021196B3C|nr:exonuclease domain-containing protein [Frankia sp. AvcI1]